MDIVGIVAAVVTFLGGLVVAKQWFQSTMWTSKEIAELLTAGAGAMTDGKLTTEEIELILEEVADVKEAIQSFKTKS